MGVALAAIAQNGDLLALDQADVSVAIVINLHLTFLLSVRVAPCGAEICGEGDHLRGEGTALTLPSLCGVEKRHMTLFDLPLPAGEG
ncbi:hypothetical protein GCM10019071_27130 [Sphingobium fuliginis]|uniref:Uncharacterized protein n=1 Tax=Sphingobium fuliginis (strain ATCC 27551) TaxID=336203 RepID=A0ABQ1F0J9_SPHSA|nr:hypothetical protein GCM10019071_27130 [Sphingobium fuliginis]